ncbi:SPOR domain-containing protein [Leptolyngbya sp. FACHB-261]|uniref:SPOR domain-containing protein n=1 Tax=Leptolyngbya sp. FACHB-261 TaxID=2692806 RepID=UPI00168906F4|nr:SPOR domain-containing protein [Leptolyngbya sp. FACHB-261]MBD2099428.1 SPOR domain-containing protein [Leptolyngbya sp. FACHB-261]
MVVHSFTALIPLLMLGQLLGQPLLAQLPPPISNPPPSQRQGTVLLGQTRDTPYVVVVPGNSQILDRLQRYIPTAFLSNSRLGRYVQAGAFANRGSAESLSHQLRDRGFDARVAYRPVRSAR